MKYCSDCGTEHNDKALFCTSCGAKFNIANQNKNAITTKLAADPALTKNIVLILFAVLFILFAVLLICNAPDGLLPCVLFSIIAGILGFFAIRPSFDHLDNKKMDLLKTVEAICISGAFFLSAFFVPDDAYDYIVFLIFAVLFSSVVAYKINKIEITLRNTIEKITLAISIVIIIISSFTCFGFLSDVL